MLQDPKLLAVPPRKVTPLRGLLTRTTGVSVCKHSEQMQHSDGPCLPLGDRLSSSLSYLTGGRGHQVHKSWPISISDTEVGLDASSGEIAPGCSSGEIAPGCVSHRGVPGRASLAPVFQNPVFYLGDLKKFDRTSSSGTMSSSEELVDQEAGLVASAFDSGEVRGPQ